MTNRSLSQSAVPRLSVQVSAGPLTGQLCWCVETCSFAARLGFAADHIGDASTGDRPVAGCDAISIDDFHRSWVGDRLTLPAAGSGPGALTLGFRPGEFVTIDGLLNQLDLLGVSLDAESVEAAATLRSRVTATFGDVELVGITGERGGRILLVFPDLRMMALRPEVDLWPYRFSWGELSEATTGTARLLIARAWSRRWGPDEEMLAQALVYNFLAEAGPVFSLAANSVSDWCLLDGELETGLGAAELHRLCLYESESLTYKQDLSVQPSTSEITQMGVGKGVDVDEC